MPTPEGPGSTIREEVPAALDGQRLDRVLSMATGLARSQVHDLVVEGGVTVDGSVEERPGRRLSAGQVVVAGLPGAGPGGPESDPDVAIEVVHEDEWLLVIDKAPGVVVHPGAGTRRGTLVSGLLARYPELAGVGQPDRPGIVHRLDKGTSGLLLVARTPAAYEELTARLAAREVSRRYVALVEGLVASDRGVVDAPVGRSARQPTRMAVSAAGREARTAYTVVRRFPLAGMSLLHCQLETGRTHQIRVHLTSIGHPVVGDRQYRRPPRPGSTGPPPGVVPGRPFLHAAELRLEHPAGTGPLVVRSPLPTDLTDSLAALEAHERGPGRPDPPGT
ncbi:MAG TPA: RluA family pseudouridine synthase [Acidimicrobiales bacterium]|nr:RluA family pseudouridine synthase [Acidimicrobiales bacterium]